MKKDERKLTDGYIAQLLGCNLKEIKEFLEGKELIKVKKAQIQLVREIRKQLKEQRNK